MRNEVIQLFAEEVGCSPSQVQPDNTLEEDLGLDAIKLAALQLSIESEIGKDIDDYQWLECRTIQDIITLAGSQLATH
ncbi:MAG: acyl carrier protein [Planctomycetota bacterium]